ncbi:MAG: hypothetical protein AcusKO_11880 [Acuticoccus sp.]
MLKTLYVHIGPPKTGTTSIQDTFRANAALLEQHGFFYYTGHKSHHAVALHMCERDRLPRHRKWHDDFFAKAAATRCETGMLSTEFMIRLSQEEIESAIAKFQGIAGHVKVLCYARHPVPFAVSAAHQAIRGAKEVAHVEASPNMRQHSALFRRWEEAVGRENMIVRAFDRDALPKGDVVEDVINLVGLQDLSPQIERHRSNEGLSVLGAQLLDAVSQRLKDNPVEVRYVKLLRNIKGPRYVLPAKTLDVVRRKTAADVAQLREEWGIDLKEPSMPPYSPPPLSEEEIASLADAVVDILRLARKEEKTPPPPPEPQGVLARLAARLRPRSGPRKATSVEDDEEAASER